MQEFYFEDKKRHVSYRGYAPNNDENMKPLEYAIYPHAFNRANMYIDMYKHGVFKGLIVDEQFFYDRAYKETIDLVENIVRRHRAPNEISELLKYDTLPKKQQEKRLKNLHLNANDILCMFVEADIQGYLLDAYRFETYPERYDEKQKPMCYAEKSDGSVDKIGDTEMSDGELKALLHDRKTVIARILHKGEHWHCFYHTLRGLNGEEPGIYGSQPHWHYVSDKYGYTREQIMERLKKCDMPSSVHIIIDR